MFLRLHKLSSKLLHVVTYTFKDKSMTNINKALATLVLSLPNTIHVLLIMTAKIASDKIVNCASYKCLYI